MLTYYRYRLPFKKPLVTGSGTFTHRAGILLLYQDGGTSLLSEASPLPGFSAETIEQVTSGLLAHRNILNQFLRSEFSLAELNRFLEHIPQHPSIQFSISFLGTALLASRKKTGLNEILGRPFIKNLNVNDIIGHEDPGRMLASIEESVNNGFHVLKVKAPSPPGQLAATLSKAAKKFPHIRFRLDANQSWPEQELENYSTLFKHLPIEYIEEPVAFTDAGHLKRILNNCALPVALDESIQDLTTLNRILEWRQPVFVIIKPMLFGNIHNLLETISVKKGTFINVVVTTALESAVGRLMTAYTAFLTGDSELAHGLNTGRLLKQDLIPGLNIKKGIVSIPELDMKYRSLKFRDDSSLLKLIS